MQDNSPKNKNSSVSVICILGACYLIYTAIQMFHLLGSGQADSPMLCVVGGGFLGLCGFLLLGFQWRAYRRDKKMQQKDTSASVRELQENPEDSDSAEEDQ